MGAIIQDTPKLEPRNAHHDHSNWHGVTLTSWFLFSNKLLLVLKHFAEKNPTNTSMLTSPHFKYNCLLSDKFPPPTSHSKVYWVESNLVTVCFVVLRKETYKVLPFISFHQRHGWNKNTLRAPDTPPKLPTSIITPISPQITCNTIEVD
jgi:hypothetical protein